MIGYAVSIELNTPVHMYVAVVDTLLCQFHFEFVKFHMYMTFKG